MSIFKFFFTNKLFCLRKNNEKSFIIDNKNLFNQVILIIQNLKNQR